MNRQSHSLTAVGLLLLMALTLGNLLTPSPAAAQDQGLENLRQTGETFRSVAKKVSPAVVFIQVEKEVSNQGPVQFFSPFDNPFNDDFFRRFFGQIPQQNQALPQLPRKRHEIGQGSGFIITADGYILTNNHVVSEADTVRVKLQDGREYTAKVIGTDPPSDLAVIKIKQDNLPFLSLGDSDQLEVGDWVLAVGNPFGLSHTLTAGIVSAKGRSGIGLNDYENFIQTDAAINPGNSGGPLVNLDGEVVGINTAIFSRSGGYMGIGFAIPINMAKQIRDQLIAHGEVTRGRLGVYIQELTAELAQSFGLDHEQGILVSQVIKDSPADKAGLRRGDVIQELNGEKVGKPGDFRNRIALVQPGTRVRLTILRDGRTKQVTATIDKLESDNSGQANESSGISGLGLTLQTLTPELAGQLGYQGEEGVLVGSVEPGSPAARAGIQQGDLIREIDRRPVTTPGQARRLLEKSKDKIHLLLISHGKASRYLALKQDD